MDKEYNLHSVIHVFSLYMYLAYVDLFFFLISEFLICLFMATSSKLVLEYNLYLKKVINSSTISDLEGNNLDYFIVNTFVSLFPKLIG